MGFWSKHNPRATVKSALAWAIGGGLIGGLSGFFGWYRSDLPHWAAFFLIPWMLIGRGLIGWAIEWQVPCDTE
ncbi:MAG: hypothetical protein EXR99_03895 [Gemmataceae bacterium]|nr:hypothetical protein [Gemmataceae bacterium]